MTPINVALAIMPMAPKNIRMGDGKRFSLFRLLPAGTALATLPAANSILWIE
jgi:hypothetical protein